jgi:hypothetical protein
MPATRRPGSGAPDEPTRVHEWHAAGSRLGNEFNSARENLTPAQKGYVSEQMGEQYSTEFNEKVLGRQSQGDRDLKQIAQGIDGVYIDASRKEIVCVEAKGQGGRASKPQQSHSYPADVGGKLLDGKGVYAAAGAHEKANAERIFQSYIDEGYRVMYELQRTSVDKQGRAVTEVERREPVFQSAGDLDNAIARTRAEVEAVPGTLRSHISESESWKGRVQDELQQQGVDVERLPAPGAQPEFAVCDQDGIRLALMQVVPGEFKDAKAAAFQAEMATKQGTRGELHYWTPDGTDRLFNDDVKRALEASDATVKYHALGDVKRSAEELRGELASDLDPKLIDSKPTTFEQGGLADPKIESPASRQAPGVASIVPDITKNFMGGMGGDFQ